MALGSVSAIQDREVRLVIGVIRRLIEGDQRTLVQAGDGIALYVNRGFLAGPNREHGVRIAILAGHLTVIGDDPIQGVVGGARGFSGQSNECCNYLTIIGYISSLLSTRGQVNIIKGSDISNLILSICRSIEQRAVSISYNTLQSLSILVIEVSGWSQYMSQPSQPLQSCTGH